MFNVQALDASDGNIWRNMEIRLRNNLTSSWICHLTH